MLQTNDPTMLRQKNSELSSKVDFLNHKVSLRQSGIRTLQKEKSDVTKVNDQHHMLYEQCRLSYLKGD